MSAFPHKYQIGLTVICTQHVLGGAQPKTIGWIVERKVTRGETHYLVKWERKGFPLEQPETSIKPHAEQFIVPTAVAKFITREDKKNMVVTYKKPFQPKREPLKPIKLSNLPKQQQEQIIENRRLIRERIQEARSKGELKD